MSNYTVLFDQDANLVRVRLAGDVPIEVHSNARDEAIKQCKENNSSKLLVDLRELSTNGINIIDCFMFGVDFSRAPMFLRVAVVKPKDKKTAYLSSFTNTVMVNRGMSASEFITLEEAEQWLLKHNSINTDG